METDLEKTVNITAALPMDPQNATIINSSAFPTRMDVLVTWASKDLHVMKVKQQYLA